jgi:hypothetical protein
MTRAPVSSFCLFVFGFCPAAFAIAVDPWTLPPRLMEHRFRGFASGTIGTTSFTDAAIDIRAIFHTAQIKRNLINQSFESLWVEHERSTIDIAGIGKAVFAQITESWSRENAIGFARDFETYITNGTDLVTFDVQSRINSYNLYDELAPFPVNSTSVIQNQFMDIQTSLGPLTLRNGSLRTGTFSALIVPEPTHFSTYFLGLFIVCGLSTHRRNCCGYASRS